MDLAQGVRAAVARGRQSGSYLGTVTAIDATALALTIDIGTGTPLTGVRWVGSYAPVVGDFVTVLRAGTSWVVLGKLSKDLTGPGFVEQTMYVAPATWALGGAWTDQAPPDDSWDWGGAHDYIQQGSEWADEAYGWREYAGIAYYQSLAAQVPVGATITAARVRMARIEAIWEGSSGAALVAPVISGHAQATLPPAGRTPAAMKLAAYTDWRPGRLAVGQASSWALPSTWLTALMSGAMTGLIFHSARVDDFAWFQTDLSGVLEITYRLPA
ncbi:hypothetical protein [Sanguibacter sp. HDW7]|uniref:hypothetical protein n=1 Tax=Sanguibacter sp. HDW7 TaxID=2714931 RepID=UPI00140D53A9|nr:hypothetical protein [Sanguibacter sp. HDW7]QIK82389.1 hypothetical protein G7063_01255 [Sanguibacter sp. HDW7]